MSQLRSQHQSEMEQVQAVQKSLNRELAALEAAMAIVQAGASQPVASVVAEVPIEVPVEPQEPKSEPPIAADSQMLIAMKSRIDDMSSNIDVLKASLGGQDVLTNQLTELRETMMSSQNQIVELQASVANRTLQLSTAVLAPKDGNDNAPMLDPALLKAAIDSSILTAIQIVTVKQDAFKSDLESKINQLAEEKQSLSLRLEQATGDANANIGRMTTG